MEVEIGRGKKGRRAYGFDDIAIVPSRRTRDPDDIDITWTLGPYRFELPLLAAAMDGVTSPTTAGAIGHLRRARVDRRVAPSAQPQGVHPRGAGAGDRGRLRLVLNRTSPHANGRGWCAGGRRARRRVYHPRRAWDRRTAGHRHRRRAGR